MVHHALTDKLSKGDNPHCTPNLGQKIPEPILRTCNQVCRTPSTRHALNTLYHTPHSAPCHPQTAAASELTFKPSLAPIYLLKHLLTTSLVPRQQAGVNQLPVERIDKKHYGWMAESWSDLSSTSSGCPASGQPVGPFDMSFKEGMDRGRVEGELEDKSRTQIAFSCVAVSSSSKTSLDFHRLAPGFLRKSAETLETCVFTCSH
ncbi:hypothetical protein NQZ68_023895 [Dissostichus eleginoides]|nr:hypothetical protein NQZ68_023895 [Dissostichus eleginoides]